MESFCLHSKRREMVEKDGKEIPGGKDGSAEPPSQTPPSSPNAVILTEDEAPLPSSLVGDLVVAIEDRLSWLVLLRFNLPPEGGASCK